MGPGEIAKSIGGIEERLNSLCDRMAKSEDIHEKHYKEFLLESSSRLADSQFKKGKMVWIGWAVTIVVLGTTGAITASVTGLFRSLYKAFGD